MQGIGGGGVFSNCVTGVSGDKVVVTPDRSGTILPVLGTGTLLADSIKRRLSSSATLMAPSEMYKKISEIFGIQIF